MSQNLISLPVPDCPVPEGFRLIPLTWRERQGKCHYCRCWTYRTFRLSRTGFRPIRVPGGPDEQTKDHKVPKANGGRGMPANVVNCCAACNVQKGSMDYAEFIALKQGGSE